MKPSWLPIRKKPYLFEIANKEMYGFNSSANGSVTVRVVFGVTCVSWRNFVYKLKFTIKIIHMFWK